MDARTLFTAGKGTIVVVTHKHRPVTEYLGDCSDGMFHFEEDPDKAVVFDGKEAAERAAGRLAQTWGSIYLLTTKVATASWYQEPTPPTTVPPPPSPFATKAAEAMRKFFTRYDVSTPEMRLAARRW